MQQKFLIVGVLVVLGVIGIVLSAGADQIGLNFTQPEASRDQAEMGWVQISGIVAGAVLVFAGIIFAVMYKPKGEDEETEEEEGDEGSSTEDSGVECPTCGSTVEADATECPECGEKFEVGPPEDAEEPESEEPDAEEPEGEEPDAEEPETEEPAVKEPAAKEPEAEESGEEGSAGDEYECPTCGATLGADDKKCPACGEEFE